MDRDAIDEDVQTSRQRGTVPAFMFLFFILYMLTSHNGDEFLARHQYQDAVRSLTWQLGNFTAWMNGTESNFTVPDRDMSIIPVRDAILPEGIRLNPYSSSYYTNITGFIRGDSTFYNISPPAIPELNSTLRWKDSVAPMTANTNMSEAVDRIGSWNWTASEKVSLSISEKPPNPSANVSERLALVHGRLEFTDTITTEDLKLEFEAVHFVANGSLFGFAAPSGRNIDIRLLPSLVPDEVTNDTARAIAPELSARITKLHNLIDAGIIEGENSLTDDTPPTSCLFELYGQIGVSYLSEELMQELENEMLNPTGIWTAEAPDLALHVMLVSKECGILYEIRTTDGVRQFAFFRKVTNYATLAALVYLTMLVALSRQVAASRTPVGLSRASRWTFFCQSVVDSISFAAHITVAVVIDGRPSLSLIAPSFLAGVVFFYEAQFSVLIHHVQASEDPRPPPPPPPPPSVPEQGQGQGATNTGTQQQETTPSLWWSFFQHVRSDPSARQWFFLFLLLIFLVRVVLSPILSFVILGVLYSSVWLPQIVRSVKKGRSSGLSKEYIMVTTVGRLFFILYFLAYPKNVLDVEPRGWSYFLAVFVLAQAMFVMAQNMFGPAFFLPQSYTVQTYDYHPPVSSLASDPEASPLKSLGDCSICMEVIQVDPPLSSEARLLRSNRKTYSVAPCHHIFHTECLQRWLDLKNICPQCRRPLPPL